MNAPKLLRPDNLALYTGGTIDWTDPATNQAKKAGISEMRILENGPICIKLSWVALLLDSEWKLDPDCKHPIPLTPGNINSLSLEDMGRGRIKFQNGNLPQSLLQPNQKGRPISFKMACGLSGTSD